MASFSFNDVLNATESTLSGGNGGNGTGGASGVKVISSQNDTGRINWARGLSDPGEMLFCGGYPELRRRANEDDAAYQARLEAMPMPAGLLEKIKAAALQRASLDTSNGRVSGFLKRLVTK